MNSLVPRMIIIGLVASVSPVAIMVLITILSRNHARRNSLIFLLGYACTLTASGLVGVFVFHLGGRGEASKASGYVDLALGILCFLVIALSTRKKEEKKPPKVERDLKASRVFSLGSLSMIVNFSTFIPYFSGLHTISLAKLEFLDGFVAFTILTFFSLITLIIPIVIYFTFPKRSEKVLASFRAWLSRHSKVIEMTVLLIFGVYLVIKGLWVIV